MGENPFFKRRKAHEIGRAGRRSEKKLSREIRGRTRPASGAIDGHKGDIAIANFLVEAKSTWRDSLSVKLEWLIKIRREARNEGKDAAVAVSFTNREGDAHRDGEWVMVPRSVWERMLDP